MSLFSKIVFQVDAEPVAPFLKVPLTTVTLDRFTVLEYDQFHFTDTPLS